MKCIALSERSVRVWSGIKLDLTHCSFRKGCNLLRVNLKMKWHLGVLTQQCECCLWISVEQSVWISVDQSVLISVDQSVLISQC